MGHGSPHQVFGLNELKQGIIKHVEAPWYFGVNLAPRKHSKLVVLLNNTNTIINKYLTGVACQRDSRGNSVSSVYVPHAVCINALLD